MDEYFMEGDQLDDDQPEDIGLHEDMLHVEEQPPAAAVVAEPDAEVAAVVNPNQLTHVKLRRLIQSDEFTSPITTAVNTSPAEALLMTLAMAQVNNFSFKAFVDSAKLLNSLFISPVIGNSSHLLDKVLHASEGIYRYFYCQKCYYSFGSVDHTTTPVLVCPERGCNTSNKIKDLTQATYFALFSISAQIQLLFMDKNIWKKLVNPKEIVKKYQDGLLRDIYDGTCYKDFAASLPLNCVEKIISFVFLYGWFSSFQVF